VEVAEEGAAQAGRGGEAGEVGGEAAREVHQRGPLAPEERQQLARPRRDDPDHPRGAPQDTYRQRAVVDASRSPPRREHVQRHVCGLERRLRLRQDQRRLPPAAVEVRQQLENTGEGTADDAAPDAALEKQDATWRAVVRPRDALRAGPLLSSLHRGGGMYVCRRAVDNTS